MAKKKPKDIGTNTLPMDSDIIPVNTGNYQDSFLYGKSIEAIDYNTGIKNKPNSAVWGNITGTLSSQTDLQSAINAKAPLASPTFTGTVSGITASMVGAPSGSGTSTGTNTGDQNLSGYAPLASPTFTGTAYASGKFRLPVGTNLY